MSNLRLEEKHTDQVRICFDYVGRTARIGDAMTREDAEAVMGKIRRALPPSPLTPLPRGEGDGLPSPPGRRVGDEGKQGLNAPPTFTSPSTVALIAANLLPLAGVLLFGWDLAHVMVLYWAESAIIGFYTALRICVVEKLMALAVVPFFVGHFGGFMAVHFIFVYGIFIRSFGSSPTDFGDLEWMGEIFEPLWPALVALAVSHGISFFVNFIGRREYSGETLSTLMTGPYKRLVVMHLTIIFGGWLVMLLDTPAPALALLVVIKTAADLLAHRREHRGLSRAFAVAKNRD